MISTINKNQLNDAIISELLLCSDSIKRNNLKTILDQIDNNYIICEIHKKSRFVFDPIAIVDPSYVNILSYNITLQYISIKKANKKDKEWLEKYWLDKYKLEIPEFKYIIKCRIGNSTKAYDFPSSIFLCYIKLPFVMSLKRKVLRIYNKIKIYIIYSRIIDIIEDIKYYIKHRGH